MEGMEGMITSLFFRMPKNLRGSIPSIALPRLITPLHQKVRCWSLRCSWPRLEVARHAPEDKR